MKNYFGKLLVASPTLDDTPFCRSVVFVLQDNEDATVGVILNKPADDSVRQAWRGLVGRDQGPETLSIGGPIPGPIIAIHSVAEAGEVPLPNGLFTSATQDNLHYVANQAENPFQVFFGLTGWQAGQLQQEIHAGAWLATDPQSDIFFSDWSAQEDGLWKKVIAGMESNFLRKVLGIKNVPNNVLDN